MAPRRDDQLFLQSILENIPDMIFVKDAKDLRFVKFNRAGEELLGLEAADLIGKNDYDLFPKTEADFFTENDRAVLRGRRLLDIPEEPIHTKRKGLRYLHTKKIPILNERGEPQYLLGISEDITERKVAQERLQQAYEELEARARQLTSANQELEAFSYSVSHDLRAPLRAINGFSQILAEDYGERLDDEGRRLIKLVQKNTHRMSTLIDDLLAFARVTRQGIETRSVPMAALARAVGEEVLRSEPGRPVTLEVGDLPEAQGDPALLRQVLSNLLGNAFKFTRHQAEARIEVGGHLEGREATYFVRDNGAGFDNKFAGKLFGVFQRLHSAEEFEGTGVGLAIVQRIIHRHGGRIWAEGEVGKGATFYFSLPASAPRP